MTADADMSGQTAIVTAGTRGIGWAIALELHRRGAHVLVCGKTSASVELARASIPAAFDRLQVVMADASSERDLASLIDRATASPGELSCIVSCVGKPSSGDAVETTPEQWDACLSLNLRAPFLLAHLCLPKIKGTKNASMTFVSSIWAITATRRRLAYSVAKAGLAAMSRNLAIDHGPDGVRVNAVAPGYINTDLLQSSLAARLGDQNGLARIGLAHPIGRIGEASDVAATVGFLASPAAGYITGQMIVIDGGITQQFALASDWT